MKDIYNQPDFGRIVTQGLDNEGDLVEVSESYFDNELHSIQVSKTRAINTTGYLDAAEKALREIHRLMQGKICHDSFTVKFDIDPRTCDINRLHVTHIPRKDKLPAHKK